MFREICMKRKPKHSFTYDIMTQKTVIRTYFGDLKKAFSVRMKKSQCGIFQAIKASIAEI